MAAHEWIPSTLGHGETVCRYCRGTNRELAVLGRMDHCDKAPPDQPPLVAPSVSVIVYGADANVLQQAQAELPGVTLIRGEDQPELPLFAGVDFSRKPDSTVRFLQRTGRATRLPVVETLPSKSGFYWARWHTPCPGTADNGECCDPEEWMVCHVVENCLDASDPEFLMVEVPGVEKWQPLSGFEWGKEVVR